MSTLLNDIKSLAKSNDGQEFVRRLFGHHAQAVLQGKSPLILFGTGDVGRDLCEVLQHHQIQPTYFVDNDPSKEGTVIHGVSTLSFARLKALEPKYLIITASHRFEAEIRQQLLGNGFSEDRIIGLAGLQHLELLRYYKHTPFYTQNPSHRLTFSDLTENEAAIERAYQLMGDPKSREIYQARLALFIEPMDFVRFSDYVSRYSDIHERERDTFDFYVSPEDYGYFNNDCLPLEADEILVDAGAYNGLSAATFAECCRRKGLHYQQIISFEPDPGNFKLLTDACSRLQNAICVQAGLWSTSTTLTLVSNGASDPGAFFQDCQGQSLTPATHSAEVQTVSLDDHFAKVPVTFIKIDRKSVV